MTTTTEPTNPVSTIALAEGERYIGGIVDAFGKTTHIILLPGDTKATWKKAKEWANEIGGDLPNRIEQALLFATAKDAFEAVAYWSHVEDGSGWAWYQNFNYGSQNFTNRSYELRARAVRRLIIE